MVQTSPSSVRVLDVAPYNQFTVTCTARAELNGEAIPFDITIEWGRNFIPLSSSDPIYMTTGSPESGYQSILSTTEMNSMNIIYSCIARLAVDSLIRAQDNIHLQVQGVCIATYTYLHTCTHTHTYTALFAEGNNHKKIALYMCC